jgi:RimJ/RimL family protein N-acetyltransferase
MNLHVTLRPWADGDFPLLERLMGDPTMMVYLGGPESPEKLQKRHARYRRIATTGEGQMFTIEIGTGLQPVPVGAIGYWETEWQAQPIWETGWSVLPEFQGQGIATLALHATINHLRGNGTYRLLHAYPSIENAPSNAICRKAGFTRVGSEDFEYPPGTWMQCNVWQFELF